MRERGGLTVHETTATFELPLEAGVLVAGDWHASISWLHRLRDRGLPQLMTTLPEPPRTLLHAGDFGYMESPQLLDAVDALARSCYLDRILVTLGNHEPYDLIDRVFEQAPRGHAIRISESVWILPRPFRFTIGSRKVLSFGGAASIDVELRTEGVDWWPSEMPSPQQASEAISSGPAELMITHECVEGGRTAKVSKALEQNRGSWSPDALAYATASRQRVTEVWNAVRPPLLLHGHMHTPDRGNTTDGRLVVSLGADGQHTNVVYVHFDDLTVTDLALDPRPGV